MPAERGRAGRELAAALLRRGVAVRVTVHGASMHPWLRDGDRAEIEPLSRPAAPGDVVLGRDPGGGLRLHRVVHAGADGRVQTRGDALWRMDQAIDAARVLGRVRRVRRGGGPWRPVGMPRVQALRALLGRADSALRYGGLKVLAWRPAAVRR